MIDSYFIRIPELLNLFKSKHDHFSFALFGARGSFKTTHLYGLYEEMLDNKIDVVFGYEIEDICICDCLILDDFASKFYKREFSTTENKEFAKLLQEIRTNIPMVITSCPHYNLLDKDFRDFFNPAQILKPGYIQLDGRILLADPPSEDLESKMRALENSGRKHRFLEGLERIKEARTKKKAKK
ncbi:hypothetical protein [Methanococcus sp. CF]